MGWIVCNGHMHMFANERFREDFLEVEEINYQHSYGAVAPWLLWAR